MIKLLIPLIFLISCFAQPQAKMEIPIPERPPRTACGSMIRDMDNAFIQISECDFVNDKINCQGIVLNTFDRFKELTAKYGCLAERERLLEEHIEVLEALIKQ